MTDMYSHQRSLIQANPNKTALVWSCGTGKSRTACEWIKSFNGNALIICPKPLLTNWERELKKWGAKADVITKEEFRAQHATLPTYRQIIIDEVHNGFLTPNFKSQMSKAIRWYLKQYQPPRVLLLSATVYTSSPWNIFSLAYYLGYNWNWQKFNMEFFNQVRMGRRVIPVVRKGSEERLANLVKRIASVVDINDCMDVPPQIHCDPEYFELSALQSVAIKAHYDPLPIVRYTSQHEIENGIWLGNEFAPPETFQSDKAERILALVKENPKIAIVCRYNAQIDELYTLINQADNTKHLYVIRGATKNRDQVTIDAENDKSCVVLIQADCAEGYNLPSFPICIFASMSYSYVKWVQICGRFLRMDNPSKTTFIYLLTEGKSIDQAIYDCIQKKEDFDIKLYEKRS